MLGLNKQTVKSFRDSFEKMIKAGPHMITVYIYRRKKEALQSISGVAARAIVTFFPA